MMSRVQAHLRSFWADSRASVPVEYGMIAVLISIIAVVAMTQIGQSTRINFEGITAVFK